MREVYLPPFKAAVDAGVASLMSAFNDIAGVPASGNAWLTDTVLRRDWGFTGFVVSDWTSVAELIPHGVAGSRAEAGRPALTAGGGLDKQSSIHVGSLAGPGAQKGARGEVRGGATGKQVKGTGGAAGLGRAGGGIGTHWKAGLGAGRRRLKTSEGGAPRVGRGGRSEGRAGEPLFARAAGR